MPDAAERSSHRGVETSASAVSHASSLNLHKIRLEADAADALAVAQVLPIRQPVVIARIEGDCCTSCRQGVPEAASAEFLAYRLLYQTVHARGGETSALLSALRLVTSEVGLAW